MSWTRIIPLLALAALCTLPATASVVYFTSPTNTYYVGVEDSPSGSCDCDYNDLLFSVTANGLELGALYGTGYLQTSAPSLSSPYTGTLNSGSPFWNNLSSDSTYANFGECLYDPTNTCTVGGGNRTRIDPTAEYLAGPGTVKAGPDSGDAGGSVDFYFYDPNDAAVTFTLIESIAGTPANDEGALYACPLGYAVNGTRTDCISLSLTSGSASLTASQVTTLGSEGTALSFELLFYSNGSHGGFGPYSSDTIVTGDSDTSIDHFAVAVGEEVTPEPASLALVGGALLALGVFSRRLRKG